MMINIAIVFFVSIIQQQNEENYIHDDSKCKCCYSKMNRNEITYKDLKENCSIFKERNKHIYDPCTW